MYDTFVYEFFKVIRTATSREIRQLSGLLKVILQYAGMDCTKAHTRTLCSANKLSIFYLNESNAKLQNQSVTFHVFRINDSLPRLQFEFRKLGIEVPKTNVPIFI